MAQAIWDILAARNLIGRIVDVVNGVPEDILPPGFLTANRTTEGDRGEYLRVKGTRKVARVQRYGGPAREIAAAGIGSTPVKLLHTLEKLSHNPTVLNLLISEGGNDSMMRQQMGRETIERQLEIFGQRFRNLRVSSIYSALATGGIAFDADGNLLPPAEAGSADFAVNYGVPTGHTGALDVFGTGAILTNWATADADILGMIKKVKKAARKVTGMPIKYAFYGEDIPGMLLGTTQFKTMVRGSAKFAEEFGDCEIPSSFGKLVWLPVEQAFFENAAGEAKDWFGPKDIVFTPELSTDWWEVIEGTYPVPRSIQLAGDMKGILGNIQQVAGPFSYCQITTDPVGINQVSGDTFLPVLKNPSAIFIATVPTS